MITKEKIVQTGKNVLEIEAEAVRAIAARLDENFYQAVELLSQTKARVIVLGMGKSGLIGRKIAATLSSCGTPAIFIHPAEAGHGDLGMIMNDDTIIAISYSGDTKEIIDLLDFVKRIGVKLIAITGVKSSKLAKYSDVVLEAKVSREAEPRGLVPTASSTASLAMGDALAIALMEKKGFQEKDFLSVHPKGQLGKLIKINNLMHVEQDVPCVQLDTPISDVLHEMTEKKLGMTCVVDSNNKLKGIITDGDLRRLIQKHREAFFSKDAENCMTSNPATINKNGLATQALNIMEKLKITSLVITNDSGEAEGIIHLHDLWRTEMF
ncbi:SIS domain-containing protein [Acidobacteriota bacterium]